MYSILLTVAMTGGQVAPAYYPYGHGHGTYGRYGSYCDGYADWDPYGTCRVQVLPMAFYPCFEVSNKRDKEAMEKKVEDMKYVLGKYEQKILNLEEKVTAMDSTNKAKHAEIFQVIDRKLADQLQVLERRQAEQATAERIRALETKVDEKFVQGFSRLEERLHMLEFRLGHEGTRRSIGGDQEGAKKSSGLDAAMDQRIQGLESLIKELVKSNTVKINIKEANYGETKGDMLKRALVIVQCPADAKLYLDNLVTAGGTNLRTFYTPILEPGVNYFYTLRVEVPREGRLLTETQRVYFQAGREVRVSFEHLNQDPSQRVEIR